MYGKETKVLEKNKMFGSMRMIMIGVMISAQLHKRLCI